MNSVIKGASYVLAHTPQMVVYNGTTQTTERIVNPESEYLKELEKTKTRGLTTFYFNDRNNKDFQEFEGKQYNPDYEFGGKVVEYNEDKSIIEIKNKLTVGDTLEIIIPGNIEVYAFNIDRLWDYETDEEIESVSPGKAGQKVKIHLPIKCNKDWILRRQK